MAFIVSVSVPLALLTMVNASVWIVTAVCAAAEPAGPVRPRPRATPAPMTPAADRPPRD
jgi:hypothetical protein